jgi:hypothetical protein
MTILACCYSELTNHTLLPPAVPSRYGYHSVKKDRMLGDSGIAMTLTKCRVCSATMHILMEAKRNIAAK